MSVIGNHRDLRQKFAIDALDIVDVHGELLHYCDEARTRRVTENRHVQLFNRDGLRREIFLEMFTAVNMADLVLAGTNDRMLMFLCCLVVEVYKI